MDGYDLLNPPWVEIEEAVEWLATYRPVSDPDQEYFSGFPNLARLESAVRSGKLCGYGSFDAGDTTIVHDYSLVDYIFVATSLPSGRKAEHEKDGIVEYRIRSRKLYPARALSDLSEPSGIFNRETSEQGYYRVLSDLRFLEEGLCAAFPPQQQIHETVGDEAADSTREVTVSKPVRRAKRKLAMAVATIMQTLTIQGFNVSKNPDRYSIAHVAKIVEVRLAAMGLAADEEEALNPATVYQAVRRYYADQRAST